MHTSLRHVDHRPWPLPGGQWTWRQSWLELAFIHYRVATASIRPMLPPGLTVQEFDGSSWVGLVPFRMSGVMRRPLPDVPGFSAFPELNLRTYVERDGKPGVWFFSLDAASRPIVLGGRHLYGLPYFRAKMALRPDRDGWRHFTSRRCRSDVRFEASYRPTGPANLARPGSFEHWATERYCLYAAPGRRLSRVEVHHVPWPIQPAEVQFQTNQILDAAGIASLDEKPICHFSTGVDVISFPPELAAEPGAHKARPYGLL